MASRAVLFVVIQLLALISAQAQSTQSLEARIKTIVNRPEFQHALFGVEVYSLTDDKILYALNADKLFVPGSVTKLLTEGAAMSLLGADYRFRTRVYRTGPVSKTGVLAGDLVLVASGDPNLSNRIQQDKLAYENEDHAYGQVLEARLVPGDPLVVIRNLAKQVASKGVKIIEGRVLVDVSLFPEGTREGGSAVVISPMALNDNVIDVIVKPGSTPGSAASLQPSPVTTYATFQNEVKTGPADSAAEIQFVTTRTTDGNLSVKVRGTVPLKGAPRPFPFAVPQPSRFAEVTFAEALRELGVDIKGSSSSGNTDWRALATLYTEENQMAEHISPPFAEDVKVTLKVSQNLHAAMTPYLLGALLQKEHDNALLAGFREMRKFLKEANLNLSAAAVALVACLIPARRAARVDPLVALRYE